jgi:carboxypeptidase Taq
MAGLEPETFFRAVNAVKPGTNRVCADELSYHLHILLRYELEVTLVSGDLPVAELPSAWNERSAALIGARASTDKEGVLQDVHWSLGLFGYFPTYTLGSLYAAQLAETYAKSHSPADEIGRGDFGALLNWLRQNVHRLGNRFSADDIVAQTTGSGLESGAFFRYVQSKQS